MVIASRISASLLRSVRGPGVKVRPQALHFIIATVSSFLVWEPFLISRVLLQGRSAPAPWSLMALVLLLVVRSWRPCPSAARSVGRVTDLQEGCCRPGDGFATPLAGQFNLKTRVAIFPQRAALADARLHDQLKLGRSSVLLLSATKQSRNLHLYSIRTCTLSISLLTTTVPAIGEKTRQVARWKCAR